MCAIVGVSVGTAGLNPPTESDQQIWVVTVSIEMFATPVAVEGGGGTSGAADNRAMSCFPDPRSDGPSWELPLATPGTMKAAAARPATAMEAATMVTRLFMC